MMRAILGVVGAVAILAIGVSVVGTNRWARQSRDLRARLSAAVHAERLPPVSLAAADTLPPPVRRYLRAVLSDGAPVISRAHFTHSGSFDMAESGGRWRPFTSDQDVVTRRPGFDWSGRIAMAPGLWVGVHDAYIAGEGILRASVLGLFPVADLAPTPELARGELMRFLAEATWYPTVLLPGQGVEWTGVDDTTARATLRDGDISVTMTWTFGPDSLVARVRADARDRTVGGTSVPTPWEGKFWNYAVRDGVRIPLDGEVAWVLPSGVQPYWRGHLESVRYTR